MPTLITLARNTTPAERERIAKELKAKPDPWASDRLIARKADRIEGVAAAIPLDVFDEPTSNLGDVVRLAKKVLEKHGITEFDVRLKSLGSIPFHAKAIRERLLKNKSLSKNPANIIYVEAKPISGVILVRMGMQQKSAASTGGITLVLEHPTTWHEAADFIRLGIAFHVSIRIVTEGDRMSEQAVNDAKDVVKGWRKANLVVSEGLGDMDNAVGFSLWGTKTEEDLKKIKAPVTFLFGNEVKGLRLSTKNKCKAVVRLGPESSEPLRASQAAAYALGLISK